jgi:hypothetical protein
LRFARRVDRFQTPLLKNGPTCKQQ